ncbi:MAG: uroporphyrinogen-III C-methyltransferase [Alphaproteobacteria bacterium]|jgi:uroporphyrin-III C-methyltransferase / precorrin-2 dehydrogenase / sirohydrochlorin ferrochelatase|nr:uroporphyrinogen-III C-methyltransferase [Alphaproteobacteria bacterium]
MNNFPAFLRLRDKQVLLVGGGDAAVAKARLLLAVEADLMVIAPKVHPEIAAWAVAGQLKWTARSFRPSDLFNSSVVFSATGLEQVDGEVAAEATLTGIAINVVDRPELSSFIVPAIVDRGAITVAISSDGASPVLARRLREQIELLLPANIGSLASFLRSFRTAVRAKIDSFDARRRIWEEVIDGPIARDVLAGRLSNAREAMVSRINRPQGRFEGEGHVAIVGAGPGDPELLTIKALRAIQDADIVVHDRLVGQGILDLIRRDAQRIYVGKAMSDHSVPQDGINDLLVTHARNGKRVVRLKGGDPFVFGRGGEELEVLRAAGVETSVIPGITAAIGCAASAGLPLTHRDFASAVTFVTGHGVDGEPDVDWAALARPQHTAVIYMGLSRASTLSEKLIAHGRSPGTPVAIIENGTMQNERVLIGTLSGIPDMVRSAQVGAPALIVVGEVAALADAARGLAFQAAQQAG